MTLYTLGHSNRPIEEFLDLLKRNAVELVVDVRTIPRSRHNPQFERDALKRSLKSIGIAYKHLPGLGGLRKPKKGSPNDGWRNKSFQGYADYMQTREFSQALRELRTLAAKKRAVIVCAEAVPWRCHRNLIADALVSRGVQVEHILGGTRNYSHQLTSWAVARNGKVTYPNPERGAVSGTHLAAPRREGKVKTTKAFRVGDRVSWNSEAGRIRGRIMRKLTHPTRFKGYVHHASREDPQYFIKSEKTGHIALHRSGVLRKLK